MRIRLIYLLYRSLQTAAIPFLTLYVVWRGLRDSRYFGTVAERLGYLPFRATVPGSVWLHAVSVGEVLSATGLLSTLRERMPPGAGLYVSCGTLAGKQAADSKLAGLADGVFYAPLDYVSAVRRVLRGLKPHVVVVLETEIWPNLYREVKRSGAKLLVVNGRISEKALPRYQRYRWFFEPVLSLPDRILVQSEHDRERYRSLGAEVELGGNLKYDFKPAEPPEELRRYFEGRSGPVWIAASTVIEDIDEDAIVIEAYKQLPGWTLLIAPRKPEQCKLGPEFPRRSAGVTGAPILVLDTIGELGSLFRFADVVFMGGTLAKRGGHNILEPAIAGKPVIVGPHLENFAEIAERFRAANALIEIRSGDELAAAVELALADRELGERGRQTALAQTGATDRAAHAILHLQGSVLLRRSHLLSLLWSAGVTWNRKRQLAKQRRLSTPVISVGGLAMGGTGKTPFVAHLASKLRELGYQPAILTRGYRRKSKERVLLYGAGETGAPIQTGDEAQILLRTGAAHLGISADRYAAGRLIEERFQPDVFLLDDGFQHARLYRDLDIVLIDSLDPLAGGGVFPAGKLREPLSALSRADVVVLTRSEGRSSTGLTRAVREHAPDALLVVSSTEVLGWRTAGRNERVELPQGRLVSFCGLGNPAAFQLTLARMGLKPERSFVFDDHHAYTHEELQKVAAGADVLVTTEKDVMNLPAGYDHVLWLEIGIKIDREEELLSKLVTKIRQGCNA